MTCASECMAAEEGLGEDSFEVPALLQLIRRAPGPEVRPPGEAKSSKSSCFKISEELRESLNRSLVPSIDHR